MLAKRTPRRASAPTAVTMSSVRRPRCCTPAPACQRRKSSICPGRAPVSGSSSTKVTFPDGLCTTLEFIAWPATSMCSVKMSAKPNTFS